jgi:mersacidin/lichenicidin family type 2 lantibiotic
MKAKQVVRAWKDEEYRLSLSDAERSRLPENPAGTIELTDADLAGATGGNAFTASRICVSFGGGCNTGLHCTSGRLPCCF